MERTKAGFIAALVACCACASTGDHGSSGKESSASSGIAPVGSGSDLDQETAQSIPDGNAKGDAFSGTYSVDAYLDECKGACSFQGQDCDVGNLDLEIVHVAEDDGHLVLDSPGSLVEHLEGGVNVDGSFDVGGIATQFGGKLELAARTLGTLSSGEKLEGTGRLHVVGSVDLEHVDCEITYDVRPH